MINPFALFHFFEYCIITVFEVHIFLTRVLLERLREFIPTVFLI